MHPRWPLLIAVCLVLAICPAVHGEAPTLKAKKREKKKTAAPRTDRHGEPLPEGAVARLGTYRLRHRWEITSMALSPDAKRIATRSGHGAIKVWDAVTGRGLHCLEPRLEDNQFDNPPGPAFSPDGKYLAAACALDVCLWDAATGRELRRFGGFDKSGLPFSHLLLVAFSADGKSLVAAATDGILRRWDVATGKETGIQDVFAGKKPRLIHNKFREESVSAATLSADGRILAVEVTRHKDDGDSGEMRSGGQSVSAVGQGVRVQDTVSGKELSRVGGLERGVGQLVLSPDGKYLGMFQVTEHQAEVHATSTGKRLYWTDASGTLFAIAFSADGPTLATAGGDDCLVLWDAATGKQLRRISGKNRAESWAASRAEAISFSADGRTIALAAGNNVRLWDPHTGKEIRRLSGHRGPVTSIRFAPDGKELTTRCGADICRWETKGWTETGWRPAEGNEKRSDPVDSSDGRYRAAEVERIDPLPYRTGVVERDGRSPHIRVWEPATGRKLEYLTGRPVEETVGSVSAIAFSPDGRMLALAVAPNSRRYVGDTIEGGASVHLWELSTGLERRVFPGHREPVCSLAFSPDGRFLISGSEDTTALVWDVTGRERAVRRASMPAKDLPVLWEALAGADAARAYRAVCALIAVPEQAVPFLQERLRPAAATQNEHLARLIGELETGSRARRTSAVRELERLGEVAEPMLRNALKEKPTLELRRRVELILAKLSGPDQDPEQLRGLRAIECLEHMAVPGARGLLKQLGGGAPEARITLEAKAALRRLESRRDSSQ